MVIGLTLLTIAATAACYYLTRSDIQAKSQSNIDMMELGLTYEAEPPKKNTAAIGRVNNNGEREATDYIDIEAGRWGADQGYPYVFEWGRIFHGYTGIDHFCDRQFRLQRLLQLAYLPLDTDHVLSRKALSYVGVATYDEQSYRQRSVRGGGPLRWPSLNYVETNSYIIDTGNMTIPFDTDGIDVNTMDLIDDDDYSDTEPTKESDVNNDKRKCSNTELDYEYTQDVD